MELIQNPLQVTDLDSSADATPPPNSLDPSEQSTPSVPTAPTFIRELPFIDDGLLRAGVLSGTDLDGRLALDLCTILKGNLVTPSEDFFVRTRYSQRDCGGIDSLLLEHGDTIVALKHRRIKEIAQPCGTHLIECAGNTRLRRFGLMSVASWTGIRLAKVLRFLDNTSMPRARPQGRHLVLVAGRDARPRRSNGKMEAASWIFSPEDLSGAFLATAMNDEPLTPDHGAPLRLVVPGWYGCSHIKWVSRIALVDLDAPATDHMRDYATRTHQDGVPELARGFKPARIQAAATPVLAELHEDSDGPLVHIEGISWGDWSPEALLAIRLGHEQGFQPILSMESRQSAAWRRWSHQFRLPTSRREPQTSRMAAIELSITHSPSTSIRMANGHYTRRIELPA